LRRTPVAIVPRERLGEWIALADHTTRPDAGMVASRVLEVLRTRGACFAPDIARAIKQPVDVVDEGLGELVASGRITCDSFGGLRSLLTATRRPGTHDGRWSLLDQDPSCDRDDTIAPAELVARQLLKRTGVIFRLTLSRERIPIPWREIARACRVLEARGEIRGGRFVAGFDGEQYALPDAIALLRRVRREGSKHRGLPELDPADPLELRGILTPGDRPSEALALALA
jgi:ATP-dependent Lhr-like helicase